MRHFVKSVGELCCQTLLLPVMLMFQLQAFCLGREAAFTGWCQLLSLLPGVSGVWLRRAFLKRCARKCGAGVCVSFGSVFSSSQVSIGDNAYLGHFCSVGEVTIEQDVLIASHVSLMNGVHQHATDRLDIPVREQPGTYEHITIGRDTWIGEHATVAADVGQHCVIGAGALVLKPVPDFAVAVGVPARIVGDRRQRVPERPAASSDQQEPSTSAADAAGRAPLQRTSSD
jgi:acetyltransferase-like isoleucine patch superfamily enzyme